MVHKVLGSVALFAVLTVGFVAVRTLWGQAHGGTMDMMSMMQDYPMMGAITQGPEAAIRRAAELGLTEEQVQRLEAIRQDARAHGAMIDRMHEIHERMSAAAEVAVFDEAAARAAFEEMSAVHTEMSIAILRNRHSVHQILTPEQREMLTEPAHGGMMGGMHRMMEDCPMMMGGHGGMMEEG